VACSEEARIALVSAARSLAKELDVEYLELREQQGHDDPDFHTKDLYVTFETPIDTDPEALMKRFPKDARYMIRKGQKGGLTVTHGREQLEDFYDVYAHSVRHLGTPVFAKKFFKILLEEMGDAASFLVVWKGRLAVAAAMTFRFRDWVLPYYAGSTLEGRKC